MSVSQVLPSLSVEAGSAVTIYRFLNMASDKQVDHCSAATVRVDGISAESQATVGGAVGMVVPDGRIAKVEAGAAISADATLESDSSGRAVTHTTTAGKYRAGKAIDAAGGAGEIIRILFKVELDEVT